MSETITGQAIPQAQSADVTTQQIKDSIAERAGGAEALAEAATKAMAGEQSSDPIQQQINQLTVRVRELETIAANRPAVPATHEVAQAVVASPAMQSLTDQLVGAAVETALTSTAAGGIASRVAELESTVATHADAVPFFHSAFAALNNHFGGKLSFLLPTPKPPADATAA